MLTDPQDGVTAPSRLHTELAARILRRLKDQGAGEGQRLVELDLCHALGVSRTPVRSALKLLESKGLVQSRANRGYVLSQALVDVQFLEDASSFSEEEEDDRLFVQIAEARMTGRLPDECTQQELVRQFGVKVTLVIRVLRRMAEVGLVERKPGNGWSFLPSIQSASAQHESYQYRLVLEPAILVQRGFVLDPVWAAGTRHLHEKFRDKPWRDTLAVEFFEMNAEFHECLARASNNRYMLSSMQQQNQLRRFLNYNWGFGRDRVLASIDEHLAILDAVEAGSEEVAAALMRLHLIKAGRSDEDQSSESRAAEA